MEQKIAQRIAAYRSKWINGGNTKPLGGADNIIYEAGRRDGFLAGIDAISAEISAFFSSKEIDDDDL